MHTASKDLHRRRLQVGYDVITTAAAAIREEPELGLHLERLDGCRVSDSQGCHHRQCQQVAGHGTGLTSRTGLTGAVCTVDGDGVCPENEFGGIP